MTFGVHMLWHVIDEIQEEDWSQYTALWHSRCDSCFLRPFTIYYTTLWDLFFRKSSNPGMSLLCYCTGAFWGDACVGLHQKLCWSPWWLGCTAFPLPIPAVTHQLVSAVVFYMSDLPWSRVGSRLTSHGLPGVAWLIWLWCVRTLQLMDVSDTGLQLAALFLSSFLKMGVTRAVFHWWGILPVFRHVVDMAVRWGATSSANSLALLVKSYEVHWLCLYWGLSVVWWHLPDWCWDSPWQGGDWCFWMECPPLLCWRWRYTIDLGCLPCPCVWHENGIIAQECHAHCSSSFGPYTAPELICNCLFVFADLFILILFYQVKV